MREVLIFLAGIATGLILCGVMVFVLMPKMMIVTQQSNFDYDTTVEKLEQSIQDNSWSHKGTMHFNDDLMKKGRDLGVKAGVLKLCKADYAYQVLSTPADRFVTCLMPCGFGVWEDGQGNVFVSKMNTGLMGKMFGGNIKKVMGGAVSADEEKILSVIK
ncbi:MAG: DUF302 domain-containing protein [Candidatus Auribacterota bacterium]